MVIMAPMVPLKAFIRDWAAEQRQQAAEKPKAASKHCRGLEINRFMCTEHGEAGCAGRDDHDQ